MLRRPVETAAIVVPQSQCYDPKDSKELRHAEGAGD